MVDSYRMTIARFRDRKTQVPGTIHSVHTIPPVASSPRALIRSSIMKQAAIIVAAVLIVGAVSAPQTATGGAGVRCAPALQSFPTWDKWPKQSSLPDPFLPPSYMTLDNAESNPDNFTQNIMNGRGPKRVTTREEWYQCQQPQLIQLLQEYLYGNYPDHSQETVEVLRYGNTMTINVTAGGKTGSFSARLSIPSSSSRKGPFPAMIFMGAPNYGREGYYTSNGYILAEIIAEEIASEMNKTGAFWDIYGGRDIGASRGPPNARRRGIANQTQVS